MPPHAHRFPWWLLILVIFLPAIPFLIAGSVFEAEIVEWSKRCSESPVLFCALVIGALSLDVFLPIPSGPLTVYAGQTLGTFTGGSASWFGLTLGAVIGYGLSRIFRLGRTDDERDDPLSIWFHRYGTWALILTRPLPLIAEACVLLAGATGMPFARFMFVVMLCHAVLSYGWAWVGAYSKALYGEITVLVASVVVPLGLSFAFQYALSLSRRKEQHSADNHQ